jgi:site-specific DNA recombinase
MSKRRARVSTEGKPWARYLRLSNAEAAEIRGLTKAERIALTNRKLDDHLAEQTAWLDARGLPYDDDLIFRDAGLSASKRHVRRPAWEAMMAAARAGQIAGITIVAIDRFTRDVSTMENLILLADTTDVQIGGPRAGRLDLTTYEGISQARGAAQQAAAEVLALSFRVREKLEVQARKGKALGPRTFGFRPVADKWTYELPQVPEEVEVLREVAGRFLAGEPLMRLCADLNERGVLTVRGNPWQPTSLARTLGRDRYGGRVMLNGEHVATMPGEPVFDAEMFAAVKALLAGRRRGARPTDGYVLTGVLLCAECKLTMMGATGPKLADGSTPRRYRCSPLSGGCTRSIAAQPIEDLVEARMVALMADENNAARIVADRVHAQDARREAEAKVTNVRRQLVTLASKWGAGEMGDDEYEAARTNMRRRRDQAKADLDALPEPAATPLVVTDSTEASAQRLAQATADWKALRIEERRHLLKDYRLRPAILPMQRGVHRSDFQRRLVFL